MTLELQSLSEGQTADESIATGLLSRVEAWPGAVLKVRPRTH